MPELTASADLNAPASRVYGILADYRGAHQRILPKFFVRLDVEEGGAGAGTVFTLVSRSFGVERKLRMIVTEPEPGRVLVESDSVMNLVTTFTVDDAGGERSRVTIHTRWPDRAGVSGLLERFLMPRYLRGVYQQELALLAAVAEG